jgi:CCR4-NOT transcriptional complex subunit CAF120
MIVSSGTQQSAPGSPAQPGLSFESQRKKRFSTLFGREDTRSLSISSIPLVAFYLSSRPKDKKKPFLTLQVATQAFAVYPERPELINKSTLMKIEGTIGNEDAAMGMRGREGWILVMPELEAGVSQTTETIRWLIGRVMFRTPSQRPLITDLQPSTMRSRYMDGLVPTLGILATPLR